jgi:hypothetical protein
MGVLRMTDAQLAILQRLVDYDAIQAEIALLRDSTGNWRYTRYTDLEHDPGPTIDNTACRNLLTIGYIHEIEWPEAASLGRIYDITEDGALAEINEGIRRYANER